MGFGFAYNYDMRRVVTSSEIDELLKALARLVLIIL